ncbi:MAG TPA: hypothetical protein VMZ53_30740 [Kofleriaceae bacterium]|nr:hypothetical protein [Kofleriaceae bacterium]
MDEVPTDARTVTLGRRVRWLDRYRRTIAIALAVVALPLIMLELGELLGNDWPGVHATMLAAMLSFCSWWLIEVALAWMTAVWETEYDRRLRERGLPRARLLRK